MKGFVFSVVVLTLTGCAPMVSVRKMGLDTYHVQVMATPNEGGAPAAKTLALGEANRYCASMDKEILITNMEQDQDWGLSNVTFRCLDKN